MVYNIIMYYQNLENFVIDNVLTEDEKTYVYEKIKEANERNSKKIVATLGHTTYFFDVSEDFKNKIIAKIQKYFNDELVITELSAAKYHNATGFVPKLHPHYDGFSESRVTFDIQLDSTIEWPIVVEGKEFTLKNNQALIFSGTDQIHWRTLKELSNNDYTDMLFVHLSRKNNVEKISDIEKSEREKRLNHYYELCKINRDPIKKVAYNGNNNARTN